MVRSEQTHDQKKQCLRGAKRFRARTLAQKKTVKRCCTALPQIGAHPDLISTFSRKKEDMYPLVLANVKTSSQTAIAQVHHAVLACSHDVCWGTASRLPIRLNLPPRTIHGNFQPFLAQKAHG
jgi:hypothetical protein